MARKISTCDSAVHATSEIMVSLENRCPLCSDGFSGGDFYDFLVVDGKHVGILIADATGTACPHA